MEEREHLEVNELRIQSGQAAGSRVGLFWFWLVCWQGQKPQTSGYFLVFCEFLGHIQAASFPVSHGFDLGKS